MAVLHRSCRSQTLCESGNLHKTELSKQGFGSGSGYLAPHCIAAVADECRCCSDSPVALIADPLVSGFACTDSVYRAKSRVRIRVLPPNCIAAIAGECRCCSDTPVQPYRPVPVD